MEDNAFKKNWNDVVDQRLTEQQNIMNPTDEQENKKVPLNVNKKMISAQVSVKQYDKFSQINKIKNVSNNSCINSFINDYVRENSYLLQ